KGDIATLKRKSAEALAKGREALRRADTAWPHLAAMGVAVPDRPSPEPFIFSIELVNAGQGESILLHYGTPDDVKLVMINAGPHAAFQDLVAPRLRALSQARFDDGPVPIELFVVGDRDEAKTGG